MNPEFIVLGLILSGALYFFWTQKVRSVSRRLQRLKSDIVRISEQEQRRFARDLHDSHCQDLTAIVFFAEAIVSSLDETDKENASRARTLANMVRKSADTAHRLASDLGALAVEQSGLVYALQELASRTRDRFGVECSLAAKGVKTIRDRVAATHLYRIAQEATSNAARHGHTKKIEVSLVVDGEQGVLKISDDGEASLMARRNQRDSVFEP